VVGRGGVGDHRTLSFRPTCLVGLGTYSVECCICGCANALCCRHGTRLLPELGSSHQHSHAACCVCTAMQSFNSVAVRVRFPDGVVLQAGFAGSEHLSALQVGRCHAVQLVVKLLASLVLHMPAHCQNTWKGGPCPETTTSCHGTAVCTTHCVAAVPKVVMITSAQRP
jgi:hypothetical protein